MTEFRLGLIGAGRMGRTHLRALSGCDAVRVVAAAEPSEQARAAVELDAIATHSDVAAMLQAGGTRWRAGGGAQHIASWARGADC